MYTVFLCAVLLIKFVNVIDHISLESSLGKLLIPMTDAFQDIKILGMIFVLGLCWVVSVAFIHAVHDYFGEPNLGLIVRTSWIHLVVGEPVMHDAFSFDEGPSHFYTGVINVLHILFSVVLLNTLLATTIETVNRMTKTSQGRQVRALMVTCMHWLALRECLQAQRWCQMSPCQARFLIFAILVFGMSILFLAFDSLFVEIVPFFTMTPILFLAKIVFLMESAVIPTRPPPSGSTRSREPIQRTTTAYIDQIPQEQASTPQHPTVNEDNMFLWICLPDFGTEGSNGEDEDLPDRMRVGRRLEERMQSVQEDFKRDLKGLEDRMGGLEDRMGKAQEDLRGDLRSVQRDLTELLGRLPPPVLS